MTQRKLNKTVSLIAVLLLALSGIKAGVPEYTSHGKSSLFTHFGKSLLTGKNDSGFLNDDGKTETSTTPVPLHPSIIDFTSGYNEMNDALFERLKQNNRYTFKMIEKIFRQYDLPVELKYMAVVESQLKYNAVSKAGAVGLWQLMPSTAQDFGLKITASHDDRKNSWKSTVAAAKYLNYLYDCFGDWLLAIAAYNSGPAPVLKAIKKSGSRNFWQLQYFLPKESRMYVKKFIATHFYFEGKGSVVTMSNLEIENYLQTLEDNKNEGEENKQSQPNNSNENSGITGWVAVLTDEKNLKPILKK